MSSRSAKATQSLKSDWTTHREVALSKQASQRTKSPVVYIINAVISHSVSFSKLLKGKIWGSSPRHKE